MTTMMFDTPGVFIEPDTSLEDLVDPHEKVELTIHSGYQAIGQVGQFVGRNRLFDEILDKIATVDIAYEDQCSAKYYVDLFDALRNSSGEYERVVEVGCYMGGSASIIAGCIDRMNFDFDVVDFSASALLFTYERIRRIFPEAGKRIRLFHGSMPQYIAKIIEEGGNDRLLFHHDGAHDFVQVTKDLSALSFIKHRLHALIIQDTHLRGTMESCNFVDLAVYAVFGTELAYQPIGTSYSEFETEMMSPNRWEGNYFMPDAPEGIVIPMSANSFKYPHPALPLSSFV